MKKSVDKDQNIVDGYKESESTESSPAAWMAWSEIEDKTDSKQVAFMNLLAKLCTQ